MKKNNFDETLKFKKKRSSDTIFTFKIISAIILVIVFFYFSSSFIKNNKF